MLLLQHSVSWVLPQTLLNACQAYSGNNQGFPYPCQSIFGLYAVPVTATVNMPSSGTPCSPAHLSVSAGNPRVILRALSLAGSTLPHMQRCTPTHSHEVIVSTSTAWQHIAEGNSVYTRCVFSTVMYVFRCLLAVTCPDACQGPASVCPCTATFSVNALALLCCRCWSYKTSEIRLIAVRKEKAGLMILNSISLIAVA